MVDFPTAFTFLNGKMIKIIQTKLLNKKSSGEKGEITCISKEGIEICCKDKCLLITKVKPESKGIMSAFDFANGSRIKLKMKFGE